MVVRFHYHDWNQAEFSTSPTKAGTGIGGIQRPMGGADQGQAGDIEKPAITPVKLDASVGANVSIGVHLSPIANHEGRVLLAIGNNGKADTGAAI